MTADKENGEKGFAGLDSMVSKVDVPEPKPPVEAAQVRPAEPPVAHPTHQRQSSQATTNDSAGSNVGIIAVGILIFLAIVAFMISSSNNNSGSKSTPNTPQSVPALPQNAPSPYELVIPDLDSRSAVSLAAMLAAAQSNDLIQADKEALEIENRRKAEKPVQDKTKFKGARALNDLGLKAHKASNSKDALGHFFGAYQMNGSADTEITENYGIALYAVAEHPSSKKAFYSSLAMTPKRAGAWIGLGKEFAINGEKDKALAAFTLALRYTKSARGAKQALLTVFHEDQNPTVQVAARDFLVGIYSAAIPEFIRPVLGNLVDVKIPVFLPSEVAAVNSEGQLMELFAVNNDFLQLDIGPEHFKIPFASEADCRAMYCSIGVISGKKLAAGELPEQQGDPVELHGGITGYVIKDVHRNTHKLVFKVGDVQYMTNLSSDSANNIEAVNTALKLGAIPVDVFIGTSALKRFEPSPVAPTYIPPAPTYNAPAPSYTPPALTQSLGCNIDYSVSLETFGEGVTVELRMGTPGNSRPISSSRSWGGNVRFSSLCPGNYFLAIGNGDSVSVTPVRLFVSDTEYTSTLTMQRGSGNVTSRRRGEL
jgi:tetratricopeptide (TPR) repeat protein